MILATVVTSSTIMNLKMKVANKQSVKTFYTSEDAVNEIYVAMGQMSSDCFNSAYQDQVAKMVVNTESGITTVDNITCNKELRLDYIHRMLNKLGMIQDNMLDSIKYKVDVNTMEKLSLDNGRLTKETLPMQLNQIARVVLTTARELFFDPYQTNKATGSFILIDPITNNTSAVGMIIDRVEDKDMHVSEELPVLDLPKLGIAPEHYEAVEKAVKELERQGVAVIIKK